MFAYLFTRELRFWLRGAMMWVFFAIVALLVFGAISSDNVTLFVALENTNRNAPYVIENYYTFAALLTLLMTVAFVNSAASREFASNTHQILFTTPLRKAPFLLARYLGSATVSLIPLLGVSAGALLGRFAPWADADRFGHENWRAHLHGILLFAIPNTLFMAAIVFAIAVLARSTIASFVGGLVLLVAYGFAQSFSTNLTNETLAAILDPFGINTYALATKYWTVADKNHLVVGFGDGLLLANRALWLAVGAAIFAFAYVRFKFTERRKKAKRVVTTAAIPVVGAMPVVSRAFGIRAEVRQFFSIARVEFKTILKSTVFIVISLAALANCLPSLFTATEAFGNVSYPVTYNILRVISGTLYLFIIPILTFFAGVLVWQERDANVADIQDALPRANWPVYVAKLLALFAAIGGMQLIAMIAGIIIQLAHGYTRLQVGLYVETLFGTDFSGFLFLAFLAFLIHVLSPNKYIGYFVFIAFVIVDAAIWGPLHVASYLAQFGRRPPMTYSDFYGYGPYLESWGWFTAYWGAFCLVLAAVTIAFWPRGREESWRVRMRTAQHRMRGPLAGFAAASTLAFAVIGLWIFYNTEVLNVVRSDRERQALQAEYEKTYKKYEGIPQPRIVDVDYAIDIQPEHNAMRLRARQTIKNETLAPISDVHFVIPDPDVYTSSISVGSAHIVKDDRRLGYRIYRLEQPMQPGETRQIELTVATKNRGFRNSYTSRIYPNGTFFDSDDQPQIGYQPAGELTDKNERKRYGLKEKALVPPLERNCSEHCRDNYITNNADWVNVHTVISTSPDQIAVAPGSLVRRWSSNRRNYFEYKLDHFGLDFYSFQSAAYQIAHDKWGDVDIEVYYLPEHPWNVPKMLRSVRKSLEYYSQHFGPYALKQARIVEFPRFATFAQGFEGTMPYSEGIGFIANLEHPDDIDEVYYVVAHEMGHQWWAHQVIGARMQGATVLSETLAQYSAMMVMEHEYGRNAMRKFLEREMDGYLRARGREKLRERPLLRVDSEQGYIHYNKGAVVMYYPRPVGRRSG